MESFKGHMVFEMTTDQFPFPSLPARISSICLLGGGDTHGAVPARASLLTIPSIFPVLRQF
jgi:hypothetical protein